MKFFILIILHLPLSASIGFSQNYLPYFREAAEFDYLSEKKREDNTEAKLTALLKNHGNLLYREKIDYIDFLISKGNISGAKTIFYSDNLPFILDTSELHHTHAYRLLLKEKDFSTQYDSLAAARGKLDFITILEIERIYSEDQALRKQRNYIDRELMLKLEQIGDSINNIKVKKIFERYQGFPDPQKVSNASSLLVVLVHLFFHISKEDFLFYTAQLKESLIKGYIYPDSYAYIVDGYYAKNFGYQLYANHRSVFPIDKYPVYNVDSLDIRRYEIGLPPYQYKIETRKAPLIPGYKYKQ